MEMDQILLLFGREDRSIYSKVILEIIMFPFVFLEVETPDHFCI